MLAYHKIYPGMEMSLKQQEIKVHPWGVLSFDHVYNGLPSQTFNLLRTNNKEIGIAAIGHFIKTGLELGETVAIVSFEHPSYLLSRFQEQGFSFDGALASEQLLYFYYKSRFSYALSFSTNYKKICEELERLATIDMRRIVFLNADVLFNLETHLLARSSAERILTSFSCRQDRVVLGCYQAVNISSHTLLDEVAKESIASYLELKKSEESESSNYDLILHNFPVLNGSSALSLRLTKKFGLNTPTMELVNNG